MDIGFVRHFESGLASLDTAIERLEIVTTAAGSFLYAGTGINGGLSSWKLTGNAAPVRLDSTYYTSAMRTMGTLDLDWLTIGGQLRTLVGVTPTGNLLSYALEDNGAIGSLSSLALGTTVAAGQAGGAITITLAGGGEAIYLADAETGATLAYTVATASTLRLAASTAAPAGTADLGEVLFETVTLSNGQQILLRADTALQGVVAYQIAADGTLRELSRLGAENGLGVNTPAAMACTQIFGTTFVVLGAAASGSLSVLKLDTDGVLRPTDHVLDTLDTRFGGVTALEVVTVGDRAFIIAGGSDDGLTLFTLLPDGRLVHLQTLVHQTGDGLENITALSTTVIGDALQIHVASGTQTGLGEFRIDLTRLGQTLVGPATGNSLIDGTARDDMLVCESTGADTLRGLAGDDILVSGPGTTRMFGGDGADTFVIRASDARQYVMDYEPGDRIDLSGLPMLRNTAQLSANPTAAGILLSYLGCEIEIVARDGRPLALQDIWSGLGFGGIDRVMVLGEVPGDRLIGTAAGERITGGIGRDTILAGAGDDTVFGEGSSDSIDGGAGNDLIEGGAGNDTILGRAGKDAIFGEDGDDWLVGGPDLTAADDLADYIDGGAGNDRIWGGYGDDWLLGGLGSDTVDGGSGDDRISDGAGNNVVKGGAGADRIFTGAGNDVISGGSNLSGGGDLGDYIDAGAGNDRVWGGYGDDWLLGRLGNDILDGGAGNDRISDGAGNNRVAGGSGADTIYTGTGNDVISGGSNLSGGGDLGDYIDSGAGNDRIWGGRGADTILAGAGNDIVSGGHDDDRISVTSGANRVNGDAGADTIFGGSDADILAGGGSSASSGDLADSIDGGGGNDRIWGGYGDDTLLGGAGNDVLHGGLGADLIEGGAGADVLYGEAGADTLTGGDGLDRFIDDGALDGTSDLITDFSGTYDRLVFADRTATADDFEVLWRHNGGDPNEADALIFYRPGTQVIWILHDVAGEDHLWLQIGGATHDLLN